MNDKKSIFKNTSKKEITRQVQFILKEPMIQMILDSIPDILLILNKNGQAVFCNIATLKSSCSDKKEDIYGLRPGEIFQCKNTSKDKYCGSSKYCESCGVLLAISTSLKGKKDIQECSLMRKNGDVYYLQVWTIPLTFKNENFIFFILKDISSEKKLISFQEIFLHDISNTVTSIYGYTSLLNDLKQELTPHAKERLVLLVKRLFEEIRSEKDLIAAENNKLELTFTTLNIKDFISDILMMVKQNSHFANREIKIVEKYNEALMTTDKAILMRVLINMLKNALEASSENEIITMEIKEFKNKISFSVHNPQYIPKKLQLQIFKRSFSTKGKNRGYGTHSIKLLTERYLKGKVTFKSSLKNGTEFKAVIPNINRIIK